MLKSTLINFRTIIINAIVEVINHGRKTAFALLGYAALSLIQCINHLLGYLEWFGSFLRIILLCRLSPILSISLSIA